MEGLALYLEILRCVFVHIRSQILTQDDGGDTRSFPEPGDASMGAGSAIGDPSTSSRLSRLKCIGDWTASGFRSPIQNNRNRQDDGPDHNS